MKPSRIFHAVVLLGCLAFSSNTFAVIDSNAPVVQLQHPNNGNCVAAGVSLNNCFTTLASLNSWISTRAPSANTPLLVQIGPGSFLGQFTCTNQGYITLQGAGRQNTIITSGTTGFSPGMLLTNCTNLNVMSLTVKGNYGAIEWSGNGITKWTDVEVIGKGQGWYENMSGFNCIQNQTKHYWLSSHIEATSSLTEASAYTAMCGESWFFGSEIVSSVTATSNNVYAIEAETNAEAHIYGSVLRTLVINSGTGSGPFGAAYATSGGMIHLHGTGIDINSQIAMPIVALTADTGGMIHADGVGYFLSTVGGATVTRIQNNGGTVMAPYLWEEGMTPQNIISADGADMQVITSTTGHPHLVISDSTCPSTWFDTVTQACR